MANRDQFAIRKQRAEKTRPPLSARTLDQYSAQEVYDHIVNHLRQQGRPALATLNEYVTPVCSYRTPEGYKCAAGCLLSDDEYRADFEDNTWVFVVRNAGFPVAHSDLIAQLQAVHDTYAEHVGNWEHEFKRVADMFGLYYAPYTPLPEQAY